MATNRLLENEWILVTGSNRGIGWSITEVLAANGANVWASTRSVSHEWNERIGELANVTGTQIRPLEMDVADNGLVKSAFAEVKRSGEPLSGVVNNAGLTYNGLLQMTSVETGHQLMQTNFFGVMHTMQAAIRLMMRQRSGSIVNVSSTAASDANAGRSVYGATKAGVSALTKAAAREWGPYGVRVNAVAPGVTDTEMLTSMSDEVLKQVEDTTDLGRRGEPREIAEAVCFLLSPLASYLSGQTIRVDGGMWA